MRTGREFKETTYPDDSLEFPTRSHIPYNLNINQRCDILEQDIPVLTAHSLKGRSSRPGISQGRRMWTSQVIIAQWAGIPGQGTGAPSKVGPYRRRRSEEVNLRPATGRAHDYILDKGGGARLYD